MVSIITFKDVSLKRRTQNGDRDILSEINVEVDRRVLVVFGASGAGKTSFVRLINGLSSPHHGFVSVLGKPVEEWAPHHLRQKVGYVCQQPVALTDSAETDLKLAADLGGHPYSGATSLYRFEALGLNLKMLQQSASHFSVGERQRFAIVRALSAKPAILILDEPTSALDEDRAYDVHRLLKTQAEKGTRLVIIEHRPALIEVYDADQVQKLELSEGKVVTS